MTVLESLVKYLSRLPGIGRKSATRLAYFLLRSDEAYVQGLSTAIHELRERIRPCRLCGAYSEDEVCPICSDPRRDQGLICVVEQPQDVEVLEQSLEFGGLYHVLNGVLAPLDGVGPDELNLRTLPERIRDLGVRELILATNPTVEGDTTALYIKQLLENQTITVSRLALGLPVGGDLEYADRLTLARSLRGRTKI